jgi:hypothetical protein
VLVQEFQQAVLNFDPAISDNALELIEDITGR